MDRIAVLVSTHSGQGQRKNDFCWATDGELVTFTSECDGEEVDGKCGCRRSFAGLDSHKATTTALVIPVEMTREQYVARLHASLVSAGYCRSGDVAGLALAESDATDLLSLAATFGVGSVVEKRGSKFQTRLPIKPATA